MIHHLKNYKKKSNNLGNTLFFILNSFLFLMGGKTILGCDWWLADNLNSSKSVFCKMDARDKAIKPSKYDFSTVFRLKENRQNLIHGMCHVFVVLHELTLLYTMQKRRDPKIFPFHCTQWSDCCWHFPSLKKKLRKELIIWWEILVLFFSAKPILGKN